MGEVERHLKRFLSILWFSLGAKCIKIPNTTLISCVESKRLKRIFFYIKNKSTSFTFFLLLYISLYIYITLYTTIFIYAILCRIYMSSLFISHLYMIFEFYNITGFIYLSNTYHHFGNITNRPPFYITHYRLIVLSEGPQIKIYIFILRGIDGSI